jgi:hypothetical protein
MTTSVPDDHHSRHDSTRRPAPAPTQQAAALALVRRFAPQGWQLNHPVADWWEAFRQDGTSQRVIIAHSVISLYAKLIKVEATDGQRRPQPPDAVAAYLADLDRLGKIGTGK